MIIIRIILMIINSALMLASYMLSRKEEKKDLQNVMIAMSVVFMLNSIFLVV